MRCPHSASVMPGWCCRCRTASTAPCRQYQHRPQTMNEHTTTRSPTLRFAHARPDFDDLAHELVAEHVARAHRRDVAAEQVQVRAAHRAQPAP